MSTTTKDAMRNVMTMLAERAAERPDAVALECGAEQWSWGRLDQTANKVAQRLLALGCELGDRVAFLSPNGLEYVAALIGALRAGCAIVPLAPMLASDVVAKMLEDSQARLIFLHASTMHSIETAPSRLRVRGACVVLEGGDSRGEDFQSWVETCEPRSPADTIPAEATFNIIYSSGTTGVPKGILHSHALRTFQVDGMRAAYGFSAETRTIVATGFYSNYGLMALMGTLAAGGTALFAPKLTPQALYQLCAKQPATHGFLVPMQIGQLLAREDFDAHVEKLHMLKISAGSALAPNLKRAVLDEWPGGLIDIYGMTEGGFVTVLEAHRHPDKLDSVGKPIAGSEMRIVDESGREAPVGEAGEIVGWSKAVMLGYHNRPGADADLHWRAADGRMFLRTGDIGRLDSDGFVYVVDRKKDMIISGGLNIYAADIERIVARHPAVAEVCVVAVPSQKWGESPLAIVVGRPGVQIDPQEVMRWVNACLSAYQRICGVVVRGDLPRGALDKVLKRNLREEYRNFEASLLQ